MCVCVCIAMSVCVYMRVCVGTRAYVCVDSIHPDVEYSKIIVSTSPFFLTN